MNIFNFVIKKNIWKLIISFILGALSAITPLVSLYIINLLVEAIISNKKYLIYLWLLVTSSIINILLYFIKFKYNKWLSLNLIKFLRSLKTNNLTNGFYDEQFDVGKVQSELLKNVPSIIQSTIIGLIDIINTFVLLILSTILLFYFHWILAIICIIFNFCSLLMTTFFTKKGAKYNLKINEINISYNSDIKKLVKSRNEMYLLQKINFFNSIILSLTISKNSEVYKKYKKLIYCHLPSIILGFILQILAPVTSSILAKSGVISLSIIVVVSFIYGAMFSSMTSLPLQFSSFFNNKILFKKLVSKNIFNINKTKKIKLINLVDFSPLIKNNVFFKKRLNILIRKGTKIHLIGKNGSGKSSTIQSIMKNSNYEGKIITNIKDNVRLIDCDNVVFINEYPHIFSGTVKENITFFSQKYKDSLIRKTIDIVNLKIPMEKEISLSKISDGQKQKIALARAIIVNPDFIFIDEGLNNISFFERGKIHRILLNMNAAIILISHKYKGDGYEKIKINK